MTSILKVDSIQTAAGKPIVNATGSVLQVQSTAKTDTGSFTGTSFADLTGVSVTITPSSSSSKVLLYVCMTGFQSADSYSAKLKLVRNSTSIGVGASAGSRTPASFVIDSYGAGSLSTVTANFHFLDSPSTTSAVTYKIQGKIDAGTFYFGRNDTDGDSAEHGRYPTIITAMEIAG